MAIKSATAGWAVVLALIILLGLTVPGIAQQASAPAKIPQGAPAQANQAATPGVIEQLEEAIAVRDEAIRNLQDRVAALEKAVKLLDQRLNQTQASVAVASQPIQRPTSRRSSASREYRREERLARAALDRALISRGGLLLPPWTLEVENGVTYYNSSSDAINIDGFTIFPILVVGNIFSQHIRRDIVLPTLTTRLGLPKDFQFEVRVPYGYEIVRANNADNTETVHRDFGLGDVQLGFTKQLTREHGSVPSLLADFQWKTRTGRDPFSLQFTQPALGTGFNSFEGSITAVKSSDPLVFFGGLSYAANLPITEMIANSSPTLNNQLVPGRINPGDTEGFEVGSALALNPQSSLSFTYQQLFTNESTLNGHRIPDSFFNEGIFQIGESYIYARGRAIDIGLGIGLTRDAPNFQFTVGLPFRLSLFHNAR
jgi:Na+-transporting methylmalonyl-CoA/oxaloacetate decarboxylase gamma subunit